jgi:hypothetical protein
MASSIEDILMAKAMADAQNRPDPAVAMGGGAAVGGVLGAVAGSVPHKIGNMVGAKPSMRQDFEWPEGLSEQSLVVDLEWVHVR